MNCALFAALSSDKSTGKFSAALSAQEVFKGEIRISFTFDYKQLQVEYVYYFVIIARVWKLLQK